MIYLALGWIYNQFFLYLYNNKSRFYKEIIVLFPIEIEIFILIKDLFLN